MLLMLNDKLDALADYVMSEKASVPWAPDEKTELTWLRPYPDYGKTLYTAAMPDVEEYNRKNWKVYKVTVPSHPHLPPNYEMRAAEDRAPPTTTVFLPCLDDGAFSGSWVPVESELLR